MLESSTATKVHSKLVKNIMTPGPTKNVMRIRKHKNRLKYYEQDPVTYQLV